MNKSRDKAQLNPVSCSIVAADNPVSGDILYCEEGLSFWGGVDATTGNIQDQQHSQVGHSLSDRVVMMPTSRGSCSGAGVLLGLALSGHAPVALVFRDSETTLTLGALVARLLFNKNIVVVKLSETDYQTLSKQTHATFHADLIESESEAISLRHPNNFKLELTELDQSFLAGHHGEAARIAMEVVLAIAKIQGAKRLIDIKQVHIDGCIYAHPAFLLFAEKMLENNAAVKVPTTLNAISVEYENRHNEESALGFAESARRLADCYLEMGAQPTFTCAPYLLETQPKLGENIAWAESNAVVYANSILGARTEKHPDFLDLCMAITGRAPDVGVYQDSLRAPDCVVTVKLPKAADDLFWPLLGWLLGQRSPYGIPLVKGLEASTPSSADLKALCASFGTTSAAPLLHIAGVTPEADSYSCEGVKPLSLRADDFIEAWEQLNASETVIDLVALGSPHFSLAECESFLELLAGRAVHANVNAIITTGRVTRTLLRDRGIEKALTALGVQVISDMCWCSMTEPAFPSDAQVLVTNSGKYAHYGPGLSGRAVRFAGLRDCADAAATGRLSYRAPSWMS